MIILTHYGQTLLLSLLDMIIINIDYYNYMFPPFYLLFTWTLPEKTRTDPCRVRQSYHQNCQGATLKLRCGIGHWGEAQLSHFLRWSPQQLGLEDSTWQILLRCSKVSAISQKKKPKKWRNQGGPPYPSYRWSYNPTINGIIDRWLGLFYP